MPLGGMGGSALCEQEANVALAPSFEAAGDDPTPNCARATTLRLAEEEASMCLLLTELDRFPRAANRKQQIASSRQQAKWGGGAVHIQPLKRPLACAAER